MNQTLKEFLLLQDYKIFYSADGIFEAKSADIDTQSVYSMAKETRPGVFNHCVWWSNRDGKLEIQNLLSALGYTLKNTKTTVIMYERTQ